MKIRKLHKIQIGDPRSITIILVGCGGTGSFAALNLARLAIANPGYNIRLVFIDPDTVEQKNIGRQYFCPADVGQPKATVLAQRLSMAFGLAITPVVERFDGTMLVRFTQNLFLDRLTLVIGCVDTPAARRDISAAMEIAAAEFHSRHHLWWLDAGNDRWAGQILLGSNNTPVPTLTPFGECTDLPWPSIQEPALLADPEPQQTTDQGLSCAELVIAGEQARPINYMMAAWLDVYVERLVIRHDLNLMATYISQRNGTAHSKSIDHGRIVDDKSRSGNIYPAGYPANQVDEIERCPACGVGPVIWGTDEIEGTGIEDIVFCPACTWQMLAEEYVETQTGPPEQLMEIQTT